MPRHRELGEDALRFGKWFAKSKFRLMEGFAAELEKPASEIDLPAVRSRFLRATKHAQRVQVARILVTVLLAAGLLTTVLSTFTAVFDAPWWLAGNVSRATDWLAAFAGWAGSATLVLLALRLAFDRYLDLVETSATFLAMQLAAAVPRGR